MSFWEPKDRPHHVCPKCHWERNKGIRLPYVGFGDVNYIEYKCEYCGHEWTEKD